MAAAVEAGGRGEAQERLVEERVAEEVGVLALHDGEPRHDYQRRHRHAGEDRPRAARPRRPGERAARREPGEERHRDPDRSLGERSEPHGETGEREPAPGVALRPRPHQAVERGRDQRGERHVEDDEARIGEHDRRGGEDGGGEERAPPAGEHADQVVGEEHGRERAQRRGQARRQLAHAEDTERACDHPEEEHGLVEVREPVQVRHAPLAERQHLARDLRVSPLVGLDERPASEGVDEGECGEREEGEAEDGAPGRRAPGRQREQADQLARDRHDAPARGVLGLAGGARVVGHGPLHDALAGEREERRQPAVRAVEEGGFLLDPRQRLGAKDAQRAGEVAHARGEEEPPPEVRERRGEATRGRIIAVRADAASEVGPLERGEERRQLGRRALEVGVEGRDQPAARGPEAGHERGGLPASPRQPERAQAVVRLGKPGEERRRVVVAAVVDDDQLPGDPERVERGAHLGHQADEVRRLVVRGHDDAHGDRIVRRYAVGRCKLQDHRTVPSEYQSGWT